MRRALPTGIAAVALAAALTAGVCGSALAYFTTTGTGAATAGVSKLSAPTISSATSAVGGTVTLSWSAVTAPGPGSVTYAVIRDGNEPAGNCPSISSRGTVTSCTDGGIEAGTHSYTVNAKWRSWTAESAAVQVKVAAATPTQLILSAATTTPTAGTADDLTITAEDEGGNVVPAYTGSHNLTFSGASASPDGTDPTVSNSSGSAIAFGKTTKINFSSGVATVSSAKNGTMKLYGAETTEISVSDGSISSQPGLALTVVAAAASKITLGAASTTPTAGAADNLTITAFDTYGNVATSYTGSHSLTFSGASASPDGDSPTVTNSSSTAVAFGSATAIGFSSGIASVSGTKNGEMRLYKSATSSLKVSDGSFTSAALSVSVAASAASELSLAAASTTPAAGATDNLTITALDPYGNTATSYTGSHSLTFSGASASPDGTAPAVVDSAGATIAFGSATAISFSAGVAKVASSKNGVMKLSRVEAASIALTDGSVSTPAGLAIVVSAGTAAKFALTHVTASAGSIAPLCIFVCTITGLGNSGTVKANVAVIDSLGNVVSALGSGHAAKITSTGGTIVGTPLAIAKTGLAESATQFTYTAKSSGDFTDTITAAKSEGTAYLSATAIASR